MTIFRCRVALVLIAGLICGCQRNPIAEKCPKEPVIAGGTTGDTASKLAKCLTDKAVIMSTSSATATEVASAAVTSCEQQLAGVQAQATINVLEAGIGNPDDEDRKIRDEAQRYALTRAVQARANQCS